MAYNLPPPWDAGYALPQNVKDEGLENRGFVTKMLPRGTYDNPKVGTGGYAVPSYVTKEQPGQGTYVTKWLPRGTAPNVPHYLDRRPQVVRQQSLGPTASKITLNGLGATTMPAAMPASYNKFGVQAAQRILAQIANVPKGSRDAVFKKICDTLDKTLYVRVMQARARNIAAGMQPGPALANALATSITAGYATEIIKTGASRSVPQPGSLLGLGIYGRSGLGADEGDVTTPTPVEVSVTLIPGYSWAAATSTVPAHWERTSRGKTDVPGPAGATIIAGSTGGGVTTMVLMPGYSWVPAAGDVAAHWERTQAGATDIPAPKGASLAINDHTTLLPGNNSGGTASGYAAWVASAENGTGKFIQAGPWLFPENGGKITIDRSPPGAWADWTYQQIKATSGKAKWCGSSSAPAFVIGKPGEKFNVANLQIDNCVPKSGVLSGTRLALPVFFVQHPTKNERWGVYLSKLTDESYDMEFKHVPEGGNIFGDIWDGIKYLVGKVVDAVKAAVEAIADLACTIASSPGAVAAGAAASTAAGIGPAPGAAGAAIAQSACYSPPPVTNVAAAAGGASIATLALIGGGVALAAILLTKKKKHP